MRQNTALFFFHFYFCSVSSRFVFFIWKKIWKKTHDAYRSSRSLSDSWILGSVDFYTQNRLRLWVHKTHRHDWNFLKKSQKMNFCVSCTTWHWFPINHECATNFIAFQIDRSNYNYRNDDTAVIVSVDSIKYVHVVIVVQCSIIR